MKHVPTFELTEIARSFENPDRVVDIPLAIIAHVPRKDFQAAYLRAEHHADINEFACDPAEVNRHVKRGSEQLGEALAEQLEAEIHQKPLQEQYSLAKQVDILALKLSRRKRLTITAATALTSVAALMTFIGIEDTPIQKQTVNGVPPYKTETKLVVEEVVAAAAGLFVGGAGVGVGLMQQPAAYALARRKARQQFAVQNA